MVWKIMMTVQVALFVFILGLAEGLRVKRDLFQLAEMIVDATGRDPLNFNGYGCYCGWGGSGTPVDKDDRCCQQHDDCYGQVTTDLTDCSPKWNHYAWKIQDKTVDCLDQAQNVKSKSNAILFKRNDNCPRRICDCDKALVECLYKNPYHNENYKLDKGLKCKSADKKGQM
ncbi:basic phospholipase A2 PA-12C-like isoform X1 [Mytilus trossulus]|uniref:basic phospholipase A2 PA-12C-like isoform X1 n=2 Tax=Mytilus trossulus TaxID=6551 RepID=UPI0030073EB0